MLVQEVPITKYGTAGVLKVRERELEQSLGPTDVALKVRYSGINFADIQMRLGLYPDAPAKPFIPGYEVSGVVDAVGADVQGFAPGDEVVAGTFFGGYTSRLVVPAWQVFPLPKNVDLAQGAALPVAFFTAYVALHEMARVRAGDKVLIECATGGVGTIAIQLARHAGAEVIGLTTTAAKKDYIARLGATPYTVAEFEADPSLKSFDVVINASGGRSIKRQMARLGHTGRIVCLGVNSGTKDGRRNLLRMGWTLLMTPIVPVLALFNHNRGVYGLNALTIMQDRGWVERLTQKLSLIEELGLVPHVDQIFPATQVALAHQRLETKQAKGKLLLSW